MGYIRFRCLWLDVTDTVVSVELAVTNTGHNSYINLALPLNHCLNHIRNVNSVQASQPANHKAFVFMTRNKSHFSVPYGTGAGSCVFLFPLRFRRSPELK